ncbi:MAG TPA: AgmX/PglI C-terminal domain-containing protein [Kofleriaceae bacterium]|nr:AgmX/PglI C-terminal domain-containing protein [Kofleriaceae bacterium]
MITKPSLGLCALIASLAVGCGGGSHADTTPAPADNAAHEQSEQIPPEKMDEINRDLDRKQQIMSHCLAIAIDNKELPKSSRGKVTVDLTIGTSGKPESVKIVSATLESKTLAECVTHHVQEIQFPELPKPLETSYTYGFETM